MLGRWELGIIFKSSEIPNKMATTTGRVYRIATVTCSVRAPRLNPFISQYVRDTISPSPTGIALDIIDLQDQALLLCDEPEIPSHLPPDDPTPHYRNEHTRRWSDTVRGYDAFIFVTPQYNWSIPASLKNALDYLFYEWKGKPTAVVTYGGKGGGKAAHHLRQILTGLQMRVAKSTAQLTVTSKTLEDCLKLDEINGADTERWRKDGMEAELQNAFKELVDMLQGGQ